LEAKAGLQAEQAEAGLEDTLNIYVTVMMMGMSLGAGFKGVTHMNPFSRRWPRCLKIL